MKKQEPSDTNKDLLHRVIYSCEEASHKSLQLVETSFVERIRLHLHFFVCKACAAYRAQIQSLVEAYKKSMEKEAEKLSQEQLQASKERVIDQFSRK